MDIAQLLKIGWVLNKPNRFGYRPIVVLIVNGKPVSAGFYSRLVELKRRDEAGQKSDTLTITLDDADNALELPPENSKIILYLGYLDLGDVVLKGTYELQSCELKGDDGGEFMVIQANAADLKNKLKGEGYEHFEDTTVGDIIKKIAGREKMQARVDPAIASIKIKYRLRNGESAIDFLTALGDELGAVIKPMGDMLVGARRGEAKSVSGKNLPTIQIEKSDCESWRVRPEGRPQYGKIKSHYIDEKTGKKVFVDAQTGLKGPEYSIREPLPSKELAQKAAEAEAKRLTRNTGDGSFTLPGLLEADAEADVIAGATFRDGIVGGWRADAVEDVIDEKGWRTTIEIKAKEDGSSSKSK